MDLREREQHARRHPWEVARAHFFQRIIADACPTPPTSVIDIGAGDGWFAEQLRSHLPASTTITCLDVHYTEQDLAAALPQGIVRRTTPPPQPAPLVLALDVLEHVEHDVEFVRDELRPLVASDGALVVSVPAHQSLFTSHDVALGHHRRHSAASLAALLDPAFEIVHEGSLFSSLLAPRAAVALVEKVRPPKGDATVDSVWRHGRLVTSSITAVLEADAAMGRMLADRRFRPPGLSVWAVCRPRP